METCDTESCPACNDPTGLRFRRAIAALENHFIERGNLGSYSDKLALVKAIAAEAGKEG